MLILNRIEEDFKKAIKEKNKELLLVLRMLKSNIKNFEIAKKDTINEDEIIKLLRTQVKRHKESINEYKKGNRDDLVKNEEKELKIIEQYLPAQLSAKVIEERVKQIMNDLTDNQKDNLGQVIGMVMKEIGSQADGQLVKEIVTRLLN